jgi:hypothetical protein
MDDQYEDEQSEGIAHQSSIDSPAMEDVKEDNEVYFPFTFTYYI